MKKSRLGSDSLDWIGKKKKKEGSKQSKSSKLSKQSKQRKQDKPSLQVEERRGLAKISQKRPRRAGQDLLLYYSIQ